MASDVGVRARDQDVLYGDSSTRDNRWPQQVYERLSEVFGGISLGDFVREPGLMITTGGLSFTAVALLAAYFLTR